MKDCINRAIAAGATGTTETIDGTFTNLRSIQMIIDM
jgi:hypothetical protein